MARKLSIRFQWEQPPACPLRMPRCGSHDGRKHIVLPSPARRRGQSTVNCPAGSPTGTESLVWISPSYGFADWVELHTILSSGADMPVAGQWSSDHWAMPMSSALATQRSLLLLFTHHITAHQMLVPGGGQRAELRQFIRVSRANHARLVPALAAVRDRMHRGPAWLDDASDPTLWALAHWRALAVAGSWVRTRDSCLVVRVADRHQAAALNASAEAIGFPIRRESGRRESRHRIVIEPQTVPAFERFILPEPKEAAVTRARR